MQKLISVLLAAWFWTASGTAQTLSRETVVLETPYGTMKLKLYEETPLHKHNFLKLVQAHFFDSLLFHRVINEFMIQGGDPLSRQAKPGDSLGHGDIGYSIPAEIRQTLIHKKGALCAARESDDINPTFASSASQFYIVMGKKRSLEDLKKYEARINKALKGRVTATYSNSIEGKAAIEQRNRLKRENKTDSVMLLTARIESATAALATPAPEYHFTDQQVAVYTTSGGTPHLDGTYTVFGEVIEGLDVIDRIAAVQRDARDRPIEDVRMRMRVVK